MKVKYAGRERLYVDILCSAVLWLLLNNTSSYNLWRLVLTLESGNTVLYNTTRKLGHVMRKQLMHCWTGYIQILAWHALTIGRGTRHQQCRRTVVQCSANINRNWYTHTILMVTSNKQVSIFTKIKKLSDIILTSFLKLRIC